MQPFIHFSMNESLIQSQIHSQFYSYTQYGVVLQEISGRCHEKTRLWGFRTGLTQTRLHSHKTGYSFEISDLGRSGIVLSMQHKQRR